MKQLDTPSRILLAGVILYALFRVDMSAAGFRGMMVGALYFLGAVVALALAYSIAEHALQSAAEGWRRRVFDPCGILHADGRPCMLPDGHRCLEHATAWVTSGYQQETRHRFDDSGDREERRAARGALPKVTNAGEVPTPVAK